MRLLLASTLLVIATSTAMADANSYLAKRYLGRSADDFFVDNGPPASTYKAQDGRVVAIWSSGRDNVTIPMVNPTNVPMSGGVDFPLECQIKVVSKGNKVIDIGVYRTTGGFGWGSLCDDIFQPK